MFTKTIYRFTCSFFTICFLSSCISNKCLEITQKGIKYKVVKKEKKEGYIFLTSKNVENDTILTIIPKKCLKEVEQKRLNIDSLPNIDFIFLGKEKLHFSNRIKDLNDDFDVLMGMGAPGISTRKSINSYNSLPKLFDCQKVR